MEQSNIAKLISNYGSRAWNMISMFAFIPFYVKILGPEGYGLIGFFSVILGILSFADGGMSSAIIREFSQNNTVSYKYNIFKKLEKYYLLICFVIFVLIFSLSKVIVTIGLNSQTIPFNDLIYYVKIIGLCVSTHLITSLYYGAYFALDSQVKANLIQFIWSTCKSGVVIIIFYLIYNTIEVYFFWQILCNVLYIIVLRFLMIRKLKNKGDIYAERIEYLPKHLTNYLSGMIFIAIISSINFQADKLITSSIFELNIFGFYNLASSLSQIPVILAIPLMLFVFPLFSKFANRNSISSEIDLNETFIKAYYLINIVSVGVVAIIFLYAEEILVLWTKNLIPVSILNDIVFDLKMLIVGSFFLSIQFPLYYLLLSKGKTKYTIIQGIVQICLGLPMLYFCSKTYGLRGVPLSWVFINLLSLVYLLIIVFKKYITIPFGRFQLKTFIVPLGSITIVNSLFYAIFNLAGDFFLLFAITGFILSIIFCVVCINYFNRMPILSVKQFYNFPNDEK